MDLFNRKKVKQLECDLDNYRERNKQLEQEVRELQEYKLKFKIAQMLVDDDPAIDELLTAYKVKKVSVNNLDGYARDRDYFRSAAHPQLAAQQQMSNYNCANNPLAGIGANIFIM